MPEWIDSPMQHSCAAIRVNLYCIHRNPFFFIFLYKKPLSISCNYYHFEFLSEVLEGKKHLINDRWNCIIFFCNKHATISSFIASLDTPSAQQIIHSDLTASGARTGALSTHENLEYGVFWSMRQWWHCCRVIIFNILVSTSNMWTNLKKEQGGVKLLENVTTTLHKHTHVTTAKTNCRKEEKTSCLVVLVTNSRI